MVTTTPRRTSHLAPRTLLSRTSHVLLILLTSLLPLFCADPEPASNLDQLAAQIASIPERGMGQPGALRTIELIEARWQATGLSCVRVPTMVSIPVTRHAWLEVGGVRGDLIPLGANRAATAGTAGKAIHGRLVMVGTGTPAELDGKRLEDAIAVLDLEGASRWRACAEAGAVAVIVRSIRNLDARAIATLSDDASLPFPRFACASGDLPVTTAITNDATKPIDATLSAEVAWEARRAWSLVGVIPGRSKTREAVLLNAGYEANGPIAGVTDGAIRAWNAATLSTAVESLARSGCERTVVAILDGGRGEMFRGLRHVAAALTMERSPNAARPSDQIAVTLFNIQSEAQQLDAIITALNDHTISSTIPHWLDAAQSHLAADSKVTTPPTTLRDTLFQLLASAAATRADQEQVVIDDLRRRLAPRQRDQLPPADATTMQHTLDQRMPTARAWRVLQQQLDRRQEPQALDSLTAPTNPQSFEAMSHAMLAEIRPATLLAAQRASAWSSIRADEASGLMQVRRLTQDTTPVHALTFDLSDGSRRFAGITAGFFITWKNDLSWIHRGLLRTAGSLRLSAYDTAVDLIPGDRAAFWNDGYLHESGVVGLYVPSVTLSTTDDARLRLGSPADTVANCDAEAFTVQARDAITLARAWIDSPELTARRITAPELTSATIRAEIRATGTASGRRPLPFAHAWIGYGSDTRWRGDVHPVETRWCDQGGETVVPLLPKSVPGFSDGAGLSVRVYDYAPTGEITAVPASAGLQATSGIGTLRLDGQLRDVLAVLFLAVPSRIHGLIDPRLMQPLNAVGVLAATRQAAPDLAHLESDDGDCVIWTEPDQRLMVTATQGRGAHRLLILGDTLRPGVFAGRPTGPLSLLTARDSAADLWQLNEQRLDNLRRSGVEAAALTDLHARAERHLAAADAALADGKRSVATGEALAAWSFAGRVYPGVQASGQDVVHGLVLLLLLAVPCAWMLERLLIAAATMLGRVLGFGAMFAGLFSVLFLLHPAAGLATTPLIILLAFLIVLLSGWVSAVLHIRFEREMALIRDGELGAMNADVARLGTLVATIELGAGNMRRRPLRTGLTIATVGLMTFTLLTFAGFNPTTAVSEVSSDVPAPYDGVLIRRNGWAALHDQTMPLLTARWGDQGTLWPLRWLTPNAGAKRLPLNGPTGSSSVLGIVGIRAGDPSHLDLALRRGAGDDAPRGLGDLPADGRDWIFLPAEVLRRCGLTPGDRLSWRGVALRAGLLEARAAADAVHVGGEPVTPLAEEALAGDGAALIDRLNLPGADGAPRLESAAFSHQDTGAVAVLRESVAARLGADLRAVAFTPRADTTDLDAVAQDMAQQLAMTLRVGHHGQTTLLTAVGRLTADGLGGALVPLVLGSLIVFATMLSTVAERGREIFIYASLGLAPVHIAALFLVEAAIYAVLGAFGGYLLAQLTAWILGFAAHVGLLAAPPDLNYSSTAAMMTMALVMAAVLISALYPALMAARAAHPSGHRPKLPSPTGDRWEVPFPVTVVTRDERGLLAFLAHWLNAAGEAGDRGFTAGEIALGEADDGDPNLRAKIWLAPFDLGLSQLILVESEHVDLPGSRGLRVVVERRSGGTSDWKRANQTFLKELRRQVLTWRTLTAEQMDVFRAKGGDDEAAKRVAGRGTKL